jgi:hypothetical protein
MILVFEVGDQLATALAKFRVVSKQDNEYVCEVLESKNHLPKVVTIKMMEDLGKYIRKVV